MPRDEEERTHRFARLVAVVAGIAGLLLCGLVPLLPVKQTTATISWPQASGPDGLITDITAPLVSGAPQALDISIPCQAVATLPDAGGLVVSTIPPAGIDASRNGLFVRATADVVVVAVRDSVAAVAPRPAVESGACSTLHIWANPGEVGADFIGIPGAAGVVSPDKKPQVAGVFTDLKVAAQAGLSARIDIDTRFITSPTPLKLGVMVLGVAAVIASIVALAVLDRRSRRVALAWRRFWRVSLATWLADIGVVGTLLLWHVIGSLSSDDGYNLTIARVSDEAGYTANYYRFFGATEAPFDWYQSVLAHLASISTASVWMRIPATLAGMATWLILSRWVLPRLGARLAANRVTVWTGGAVFLAAWLPFNNGLRPEPLIAFGVIAAWALVEYAIGARRVAPYAVAIVVAMFSVTLAPQGLIAVAPLLVGARAVAADHPPPSCGGRYGRAAGHSAFFGSADLRHRVPRPDAGHRRRVGPHQIRCRPDDRLVPGVSALLLPDRRGQRRLVADPSIRRAGAAALPVRHADRPAAQGRRARYGTRPRVAADRYDGHRPSAADVHADEVGASSSACSPAWPVRWARSPRSRSRGSGCTADETSRCT